MPKILVVEDTQECLEGLLELLELEGHEVTGCDTGQKAIATTKGDHGFDLIFCDVILPGITGWNILSELRERGDKTPFCYITAMVSQSDKEVAARLGSDWYIAKPYSIADIRDAIARLTGKE